MHVHRAPEHPRALEHPRSDCNCERLSTCALIVTRVTVNERQHKFHSRVRPRADTDEVLRPPSWAAGGGAPHNCPRVNCFFLGGSIPIPPTAMCPLITCTTPRASLLLLLLGEGGAELELELEVESAAAAAASRPGGAAVPPWPLSPLPLPLPPSIRAATASVV